MPPPRFLSDIPNLARALALFPLCAFNAIFERSQTPHFESGKSAKFTNTNYEFFAFGVSLLNRIIGSTQIKQSNFDNELCYHDNDVPLKLQFFMNPIDLKLERCPNFDAFI